MKALWDAFLEYADCCTIHGIKYMAEPKRSICERIWWILAFVISIYGSGILILSIWDKWDNSPVIVSFADKSTTMLQIPFPAITICPQTQLNSVIFNTTDQLCSMDEIFCNNKTSDKSFTIAECMKYIHAPYFKNVFYLCFQKASLVSTRNLFKKIITDVGLCYTFNMLNADELYNINEIQTDYNYIEPSRKSTNWTLENGYSKDAPFDSYPMRVLSSKKKDSVQLILGAFDSEITGFKVLFHTPSDLPQFTKNHHNVQLDRQISYTLTPNMITTTENLINYYPNKRQCFFNKDMHLKYFTAYTQQNCELECVTNYTLSKCGCVKLSMPSAPGTPICDEKSISCYMKAENELEVNQLREVLNTSNDKVDGQTNCNCLPSCTSIVYDIETAQLNLNWKTFLLSSKEHTDEKVKVAYITISFKAMEFISTKRTELYGSTDFMANCGGLLGLFMGVSVLSLVEIVYFFTIRLYSNLRKKKINFYETENIENKFIDF